VVYTAHLRQQCHNTTVATQQCHNTTQQSQHNNVTTQQSQHNSVTTQQCHNTSVTTQQCHNTKCVIFQYKRLNVLKCYNFLRVQRRHNCSQAASFANCVMTLYLLKVHLQTFLSISITQKCQILRCDSIVANVRYSKHKVWKVKVPSALRCHSSCVRAAERRNSGCQSIILRMGCFECLRKTLKAR
jgi:hypothetical protein